MKSKKLEGWIDVSLEGFAQQNAARPIEHLVKELLQNSLDSIESGEGHINLNTIPSENKDFTWIVCTDNGVGIKNIENIRTVFWTSKQDSHLKRGRMGRGFKELLCLSQEVKVKSLNKLAHFKIEPDNKRTLEIKENISSPKDSDSLTSKSKQADTKSPSDTSGTSVSMLLKLNQVETSDKLKNYFQKILLPANCTLNVEGIEILPQTPTYTIDATLTTESFEEGKWIKPQRKTQIEIYRTQKTDPHGFVFEMGIPICPVEWDLPYHVNILQRVPMNPNRDAVMSGYISKIHKSCLGTLIQEMDSEQARATWVGEAALGSQNSDLQRTVLEKAFGQNLARAVPGFGKFDYNADAYEMAGARILYTKQLSGGFRELAKLHLPTAKEVANKAQKETQLKACTNSINIDKISEDPKNPLNSQAINIINKHGLEKIKAACDFYKFLADEILKKLPTQSSTIYPHCKVEVAIMADVAEATWSRQSSILTLALDLDRIWENPFEQENFSLIIHEVAHELAAHHGHGFANALEQCAGACCIAIIENQEKINEFKKRINTSSTLQNCKQ